MVGQVSPPRVTPGLGRILGERSQQLCIISVLPIVEAGTMVSTVNGSTGVIVLLVWHQFQCKGSSAVGGWDKITSHELESWPQCRIRLWTGRLEPGTQRRAEKRTWQSADRS